VKAGRKTLPQDSVFRKEAPAAMMGMGVACCWCGEREHIASWLSMNLWLGLRKIPYSSKAYSGCGVDECGERVGKDVVWCFGKKYAGVRGKV
jgi:hypothetical protein